VFTLIWQIISCGAGFDTSFFRLAAGGSLHPEVCFYEVDFAEVVDRKAECILGSQSLQDCIGSFEGKIYTGCPRWNVPDFGRVFPILRYADVTQNTYVQSLTVAEIMAREKWGLLVGPHTVPVS
jgi:hypothetical protein